MIFPSEYGFFMPAEYSRHDRCWMAWPCRREAFGDHFEAARKAYAEVARIISRFEPVTMVAHPMDAPNAGMLCGSSVNIFPLEIDDSWTRDTGPTFIVGEKGEVAGIDWIFNGWGGVWPNCANDARLAEAIIDYLGMARFRADVVLEGGGIHVDGEGTLMAVAPCLLDPGRNPDLTLPDLEKILSAFLGIRHFIWLDHGLYNDETNGHVDNAACFARPGLVLVSSTSDPDDPDYHGSRENIARLAKTRDAAGRTLNVVEIEQPARRMGKDGLLALSYINFYLPNGGVVAPAFGDPKDQIAFNTLREIFPDREVVQVEVMDILHGGGGIHCITQQQPAGRPAGPDILQSRQ